MKKFSLDIQPDFDFHAIGIVCQIADYKLCYHVNLALNWDLAQSDTPIEIEWGEEDKTVEFGLFEYRQDNLRIVLHDNKVGGHRLIPEYKDADYIVVLHGANEDLVTKTLKNLRTVKHVLFTYNLDLEKIGDPSILLPQENDKDQDNSHTRPSINR